jgi:large subunit ribosomal protein L24
VKIKKGDQVIVLSGKDKGKQGKVLAVNVSAEKLIVENVMMVKRHTKPTQKFRGGIVEKPSMISSAKVMIICPICTKPTRIGAKQEANKKKVRVCKKCGEVLDKE